MGARRKRIAAFVFSAVAVTADLFVNGASAAQSYVGIDLYTLAPPADYPVPNNSYGPTYAMGGQVVGASSVIPNFLSGDALLWNGPSGAVTVLSPTDLPHAAANATNGSKQVGWGSPGSNPLGHALLWDGSAQSAVDLNPTNLIGYEFSLAQGINLNGSQEVGWGAGSATSGYQHAMLWNSAANTAVDLHPSTFLRSFARASDGVRQVGVADNSDPFGHALLWSGSAGSAVDLQPTNLGIFDSSTAEGIFGSDVVGNGHVAGTAVHHALLWQGTADSAVDLHPAGASLFDSSSAIGTNGVSQVGYIYSGSNTGLAEAYVWGGSAGSAMNLDALLPFQSQSSEAFSVDAQGVVYGLATDPAGNTHAVEWVPAPEPNGAVLLGMTSLLFLLSRQVRLGTSPLLARGIR